MKTYHNNCVRGISYDTHPVQKEKNHKKSALVITMMVFQDDLFQPKNAKKSALDNDAITESANQNRIIAKHFQITGLDGTVNICINVLTKEVL